MQWRRTPSSWKKLHRLQIFSAKLAKRYSGRMPRNGSREREW